MVSAVQLLILICRQRKKYAKKLRRLAHHIISRLSALLRATYDPDHDIGGVTDPFLQVHLLQLLRIISIGDSKLNDEVESTLASIATNTESNKNPGNAILYECVRTIMSFEKQSSLHVLAINILGRFLVNRDNNVRYVALNALCNAVQTNTHAIQRHRNTIVECLKDADLTIRKRSLDLVYALTNKKNVKTLVRDLLGFLCETSDKEKDFKHELARKICMIVEQYASSYKYHFDIAVDVLASVPSFDRDLVVSNLYIILSNSDELQSYAVFKLFDLLVEDQDSHKLLHSLKKRKKDDPYLCTSLLSQDQKWLFSADCDPSSTQFTWYSDALKRLCAWCIGEYAEKLTSQDCAHEATIMYNDDLLYSSLSSNRSRFVVPPPPLLGKDNGDDSSDEHSNKLRGKGKKSKDEDAKEHTEASEGTTQFVSGDPVDFRCKTVKQIVNKLECILNHERSSSITKGYALTALTKCMQRFHEEGDEDMARVRKVLDTHRRSQNVDLQQRSCEFLGLFDEEEEEEEDDEERRVSARIRDEVLKPMPVPDIDRFELNRGSGGDLKDDEGEEEEDEEEEEEKSSVSEEEEEEEEEEEDEERRRRKKKRKSSDEDSNEDDVYTKDKKKGKKSSKKPVVPTLARPSADVGVKNGSEVGVEKNGGGGGGEELNLFGSDDLLGVDATASKSEVQQNDQDLLGELLGFGTPVQAQSGSKAENKMTAMEKDGVSCVFQFVKAQPGTARVQAEFCNSSADTITNLSFMVAVPKYIKLQIKPANGTVLNPLSQNVVHQKFQVTNTKHGEKAIMVRIQVSFTKNGNQNVVERGQVTFPAEASQ